MRIGYQGEALSYSDQAVGELFPDGERVGFHSFVAAFESLRDGAIERLVVPIENSTTGSVLPVLDRLLPGQVHIIAEHLVEVRHALLGLHGSALEGIKRVRSHPEALAQAEAILTHWGWEPVPVHDTAGAVRQIAEQDDPTEAALAPERVAEPFGLTVLLRDVVDRPHNTTRFVVLVPGQVADRRRRRQDHRCLHDRPYSGRAGPGPDRIGAAGRQPDPDRVTPYRGGMAISHVRRSDPSARAGGVARVFEPPPATLSDLRFLGTYRSVIR